MEGGRRRGFSETGEVPFESGRKDRKTGTCKSMHEAALASIAYREAFKLAEEVLLKYSSFFHPNYETTRKRKSFLEKTHHRLKHRDFLKTQQLQFKGERQCQIQVQAVIHLHAAARH